MSHRLLFYEFSIFHYIPHEDTDQYYFPLGIHKAADIWSAEER